MKKPQKTTTMKVIKTTEGKLRLISYKEANYDEALTARIQDRMAEANYLEMTTATVKSEAKWKTQFQIMWNNTPKKLRRTISQVNNIKSQAKLYVALWT